MINFRFHLVSLIAVFLALAAGIVVGSTVVDTAVVDGLRSQIRSVERRADRIAAQNHALSSDVRRLSDESQAIVPYATADRLNGVPVAVIARRGVDGRSVDDVAGAIRDAGGTAPAVLQNGVQPWSRPPSAPPAAP